MKRDNSLYQNGQENILTHQTLHSKNVIKKELSSVSELKYTEDTKLLLTNDKKTVILESHSKVKKKIWKDKLQFSDINFQNTELSKILDQDLILRENVLKPFWNQQCEKISKSFWIPTKIDYVNSDLIEGKSWFSITKTTHQNKKCQKTTSPLSQFLRGDYMENAVTEIHETESKTWFTADNDEPEYKTLNFHMFCNEQNKKALKLQFEQSKWYGNAAKDIFLKENDLTELKKKILVEKELMIKYKKQYIEIKKIKDKTEREKQLEELKKTKPVLTRLNNAKFRDNMKKYIYTEESIWDDTAILADFVKDETNNELAVPKYWLNTKMHSRLPRGAIKNFVGNMNSMIVNYRNSERDFTIKYDSSKKKNECIYFEDACYDKFINSIDSKYCYTTVINGQKKRTSISFQDIKKYTKIKSLVITHDKSTDRYILHLAVDKNFYLPNDKRTESQGL